MADEGLLVFSESQQQAVLGHALQNPKIFEILDEIGVDEKWMVTNALADCYKNVLGFRKTYERTPKSAEELTDYVTDELIKASIQRTLSKCVESKKRHAWDGLEKHLVTWAKSRHVYTSLKELAEKYNEGKHQEAYDLLEESSVRLQQIESCVGLEPDGFKAATERIQNHTDRRAADAAKTVPFAIKYLQDLTGGMLPTDIALFGATSGAGKTEAAKIQAAFLARQQLDVHYFALEAEPDEIEMRILYGIMARMYKEEHTNIPLGMISYGNWRKYRLENELGPYQKRADEEFAKDYSTLHTYYRRRGDFGISQMRKQMLALKGHSRQILLDHIHFLDMETDNEVREMSDLVKQVRGIAALIEIPIILVAHITEKGVKHNELVPRKEDFYGASNLFKTVTTAIMMAPVFGFSASDARACGKPTFLRVVKARLDNSAQYYPGIVFFDPFTNNYTPHYSVGKFEKGNRKWSSLKGDMPYWVDMENNVVDVSDVE